MSVELKILKSKLGVHPHQLLVDLLYTAFQHGEWCAEVDSNMAGIL